jgi:hypothetical protein
VSAQGSVTGPGGFSAALTATQVFQGLAPGSYAVSPANVVSGATTFTSPSQGGTVVAGQTTSVGVTYSAVPNPILTIAGGGTGTGSGRVASTPPGIDCTITNGATSGTCAAAFANNSSVQLAATEGTLTGWANACSGTGTCQVTMSGDRQVTATFGIAPIIMINTTKPVIVTNRVVTDVTFSYPIQNGGGGTLTPTVSIANQPSWLQVSIVGGNLQVKINAVGLLPYSESKTPYVATATLSAPGAASVPLTITYSKTFDQPAGMAATLVHFHRYTGESTETPVPSNVSAQVDLFDARSNKRIAAKVFEVSPSTQNWLVPTINASGQLDLKPKPFSRDSQPIPFGNLPAGTDLLGTPIRIRLVAADGSTTCPTLSTLADPSCQVFVYYDADEFPRLLLRPWGVYLTPDKPPGDVVWEKQSNSPHALKPPTILTHDCGNRLASPPAVVGTHISIVGNFNAIGDDSTFRCTVKVGATYVDSSDKTAPITRTDTARLFVSLAKPSPDLITPSQLDLNILATAGGSVPTAESINLNNLGPNAIPVSVPSFTAVASGGLPACPATLLLAPTVTGSTIGRGAVATVKVQINPQNQPAQVCSATLGFSAAGLAPRFIPVVIRLK